MPKFDKQNRVLEDWQIRQIIEHNKQEALKRRQIYLQQIRQKIANNKADALDRRRKILKETNEIRGILKDTRQIPYDVEKKTPEWNRLIMRKAFTKAKAISKSINSWERIIAGTKITRADLLYRRKLLCLKNYYLKKGNYIKNKLHF